MSDPAKAPPSRGLILSLGGSPRPLIESIRRQRPERIAFLASTESREGSLSEVVTALGIAPESVSLILTPNAQSLHATLATLLRDLPEILAAWERQGVARDDVAVDLTGGTKAMSSALALAAIPFSRRFVYVGGEQRDRGGLGAVVDGSEMVLEEQNPWELLGVDLEHSFAWAFNRLQFAAAERTAESARLRVEPERASYFASLRRLAVGYGAWERFQYGVARQEIHHARLALARRWGSEPRFAETLAAVLENELRLRELQANREWPDRALLVDLASSAWRRGQEEGRYDDAVSRLYRFVEGLGQEALGATHGVPTSRVPLELLPRSWPEGRRTAAQRKGSVELALDRTFRLLAHLGHPLGQRGLPLMAPPLRDRPGGTLRGLLDRRNASLLAHGTRPVAKVDFEALFAESLALADLHSDELTRFPRLPER